jgi:demethylmenaquinone methyltransferase/2-methoxy-6-polyprenyl-1,4-benzoquinol methylase
MDVLELGRSRLINLLVRPGGATMESRLRRWLMPPEKTLQAARIKPGQTVLEVGCGTGFFTLPAAEMIGENGRLIAIDPVSDYIAKVKQKVADAGLSNVDVLRRDGLDTGLPPGSIDVALLFGVVPFPSLPLRKLLPEMHRVLKPEGTLAVWLFPTTAGVPSAISRSGLFAESGRRDGVFTYSRLSD